MRVTPSERRTAGLAALAYDPNRRFGWTRPIGAAAAGAAGVEMQTGVGAARVWPQMLHGSPPAYCEGEGREAREGARARV